MKTWAPRGAARRGLLPTLHVPLTRAHLSVISAITEDVRLLSRTWNGSIDGTRVVEFLQHILRQVSGKVLVVWDGAPTHRCHAVKRVAGGGSSQAAEAAEAARLCPRTEPCCRDLAMA